MVGPATAQSPQSPVYSPFSDDDQDDEKLS